MPTTTNTAILDQLAAHAGNLYTLPAVALEILQLTSSAKVDVRALKDRIECDPALTTKILRTVNSAIFGFSGQISDLNQALSLLGTKSLKMLVLGFSLPKKIFDGVDQEVLSHYWRHTLTRAVASRVLCHTMRSKLGDETFIAAILQDLGILVLIQELGEPYAQLFRRAYEDHHDLLTLEYRATGFDHTQLTARLLRKWMLPESLIYTIDTDPHVKTTLSADVLQQRAILAVAEKVAIVLADQRLDELPAMVQLATETLYLSQGQCFDAMGQIEELVLQLGDILSLHLPDGLGYEDLLEQARQRMEEVSATLDEEEARNKISPAEHALLERELQNVNQALSNKMLSKTEPPPSDEVNKDHSVEKVSSRQEPPSPLPPPHLVESARKQTEGAENGSDGAVLLDRVNKAIHLCRQKRIPLSLLLSDVVMHDGSGLTQYLLSTEKRSLLEKWLGNARDDLQQICTNLDHSYHVSCSFGENGVAVVLLDCERSDAVKLANEIFDSMPEEYHGVPNQDDEGQEAGIRLGLGIASVSSISPNFIAQGLIEGAERCLHASLGTTAGRSVKSIEVF